MSVLLSFTGHVCGWRLLTTNRLAIPPSRLCQMFAYSRHIHILLWDTQGNYLLLGIRPLVTNSSWTRKIKQWFESRNFSHKSSRHLKNVIIYKAPYYIINIFHVIKLEQFSEFGCNISSGISFMFFVMQFPHSPIKSRNISNNSTTLNITTWRNTILIL
jgi:hypothetical protein